MVFLRLMFLVQALLVTYSFAQVRVVEFVGGSSSLDGWKNINTANFPGTGRYPGGAGWSTPMESNALNSGDAQILRVAGTGTGSGPFVSGSSIYFADTNLNHLPNTFGGTLQVKDSTPLNGLQTIIFQVQIGEIMGFDFFSPSGAPSLRLSGSTAIISPLFSGILDRYQDGFFASPGSGQNEPIYVNTWGYQWDVSTFGPISSFTIDFSGVTHAQIYELQLDQSSQFFAAALIPEPSAAPLILTAALCALARRRTRS